MVSPISESSVTLPFRSSRVTSSSKLATGPVTFSL